ncbi:hypothetical protein [Haploplasma axanthum]|uniref:Uncharacterized protein n=1 Tax=Haploplasma axanthum TaxID=29552 RepID=A0A449BDH6_HAPAX|nr:hypothetical protein [Haploplasma axanthum]VEU80482.1 Uncharacterised protein [Haploplasma axanthum]
MRIEKRSIVFQLLMYILFLLLAIFMIVRTVVGKEWVLYVGLGVFIVLGIIFFLMYKKGSVKPIEIRKAEIIINKYNLYVFMVGYLAQMLITNESIKNIVFWITSVILILSALVGIILHSRILLRDKNSRNIEIIG